MKRNRFLADAVAALKRQQIPEAIEAALAGLAEGPPLARQAFEAGMDIGRKAVAAGALPQDQILSSAETFLELMAAAPTAAAGFKKLRQQFGVTGPQIAERLGVDKRTVWLWETGRNPLPPHAIAALVAMVADRSVPLAPRLTGDDVRRLRCSLQATQEEFAGMLKVSARTVVRWEAGGHREISASGSAIIRSLPLAA